VRGNEPDWCHLLFPHYHDRQGRVRYISEDYDDTSANAETD
jgi:hypothetical protein